MGHTLWFVPFLLLCMGNYAQWANDCDEGDDEVSLMQIRHADTLRQKPAQHRDTRHKVIKDAIEHKRLDTVLDDAQCFGTVWEPGSKLPRNLNLTLVKTPRTSNSTEQLWQIGEGQPGAGSYVKLTNLTAGDWDGLKRMHAAQIVVPASVIIQDEDNDYFLVSADIGEEVREKGDELSLNTIFRDVPADVQWILAQQLARVHMVDIAIGNDERLPRMTGSQTANRSGFQNILKRTDKNKKYFILGMNAASKVNLAQTADKALADADTEFQAMLDDEDGLKYARWMISNITKSKDLDPSGVENQEWLAWAFWSGMVVLKENVDWEDDYNDWFILDADSCSKIRTECLAFVREQDKTHAVAVNDLVKDLCDKWKDTKDALLECQVGATQIVRQTLDVETWKSLL